MKLVTYAKGAQLRGGILAGDIVVDLDAGFGLLEEEARRPHDAAGVRARYGDGVLGFIQNAAVARPAADELVRRLEKRSLPEARAGAPLTLPAKGLVLASPLPHPPSMRDGYAFRQHVATARKNRGLEMIPEFDQFPVFYFTNDQPISGPGNVLVETL